MKVNEQIDSILDKHEMPESQKEIFKQMIKMAKIYQRGAEKNLRSFIESKIDEETKNEVSSN